MSSESISQTTLNVILFLLGVLNLSISSCGYCGYACYPYIFGVITIDVIMLGIATSPRIKDYAIDRCYLCLRYVGEFIVYLETLKSEAHQFLLENLKCGYGIEREVVILTKDVKVLETYYFYNDKRYRIVTPCAKRSPRLITNAMDSRGNNILDMLIEAMGPHKNFHGIPTTPIMLGLDEITVTYSNRKVKIYNADTVILITPQ